MYSRTLVARRYAPVLCCCCSLRVNRLRRTPSDWLRTREHSDTPTWQLTLWWI